MPTAKRSSFGVNVRGDGLLPFTFRDKKKHDDDDNDDEDDKDHHLKSADECVSWFQRWPRRWILLMRRLSVPMQMIGLTMVLVLWGVFMTLSSAGGAQPLSLSSSLSSSWASSSRTMNAADSSVLSKHHLSFRKRPTDIPDFPRLVKLGSMQLSVFDDNGRTITLTGGGNVTLASALDFSIDKVPPLGSRELIERYNPMPIDVPKLKAASTLDKGKCQALHDWQTGHNPNCNVVHESSWGFVHPLGWDYAQVPEDFDFDEVDEAGELFDDGNEQLRMVDGGAFRWVWMIREFDGTRRALKTLRIDGKTKNFDLRNFDRHRRDAVSMDQLTGSPLVVDMYGYCSNTGLFDWGEGGDLSRIFKQRPGVSNEELLRIAYNVSLSIHDAHHFDDQGRATIAHTDVKPDQFLYQNGYYRLTDFNRVRFLTWNREADKPCGFKVAKNGGSWRSPEEYAYELETEKVDVYSLGNVLYFMLMRENPWNGVRNSKEIFRRVQVGQRPNIPEDIESSTDIFHRYMIQAMKQAWTHDQFERPGAYEVAKILQQGIDEYETASKKEGG